MLGVAAPGAGYSKIDDAVEAAKTVKKSGKVTDLGPNGERARHFTDPKTLDAIKAEGTIKPGRGGVVDVEVGPPFGSTLPGNKGPRRELGSSGEGAFVEFDLPSNARSTFVGPRRTASIPGSVNLVGRNPTFKKMSLILRFFLGSGR